MSAERLLPDPTPVYDPRTYEAGVPFDLIDSLREAAPVIWVDEAPLPDWDAGEGFWLVTRHAEIERVLKAPQVFSSWLGGTQLRNPATAADLAYVRRMMLNMDPPDHTRLRRLLASAFTSRAMNELGAKIDAHARAIVARAFGAGDAGECDFAKDVAADLPLFALADILGVPPEDRWLFFDWANRVIGFQDPEYAVSNTFDPAGGTAMAREALALRPEPDASGRMPDPRTRAGMPDLYHYAHLLAEAKRADPGSDVMSILLAEVDEQGGRVTNEEFENLFWLFAVAGNETLRNGIPGGMIALLEHPEAMAALRADRRLIAGAVEEMLRWWTPVLIFRRTAREDVTLAGADIRAGDKVVVSFISGNRDPRVFEDPHRFDLHRASNPHLSFGHGPHFCLGGQLARLQMRCLFAAVLDATSEIVPSGTPAYLRSNFQRGVKRLPIAWRR